MKLIFALTGSIKGKEEWRRTKAKEREEGFFGSMLKLTMEFRFKFLYNRFNPIPVCSIVRGCEDVCERGKNIYFRGIRPSVVSVCPLSTFPHTLLPPSCNPSSPFAPFSLPLPVFSLSWPGCSCT